MRFGVVYPQTQFGADPAQMRDFVQAAEDLAITISWRMTMCWARIPTATAGSRADPTPSAMIFTNRSPYSVGWRR